jgi:hypothetical protein
VGKNRFSKEQNCSSLVIELCVSGTLQTPNSARAAPLYICGNGALERSSSVVLESPWSNFLRGKSCS